MGQLGGVGDDPVMGIGIREGYPGKADIIISAINQASDEGEKMGLTGKELQDYIEEKILDRVDP